MAGSVFSTLPVWFLGACGTVIRVPRLLALLSQILATRSLRRSNHRPPKVLTGRAEVACGKAAEATPCGRPFRGTTPTALAVTCVAAPRKFLIAICHSQDRPSSAWGSGPPAFETSISTRRHLRYGE
jgi:hypothetical protein